MNIAGIAMLSQAQTDAAANLAADINLWLVCLNAFAAVIVLLSILALLMRALLWLLPQTVEQPAFSHSLPGPQPHPAQGGLDAVLVAGMAAAAATAVPGGRLTYIQETTR
jgi:hypothetical protein